MDIVWVAAGGIEHHAAEALPSLLARDDGFVWVDIPDWDATTAPVLREVFGFHPLAIQECQERSQVAKIHAYRDHFFVVLHAPHAAADGFVQVSEFDHFVSHRYLVTVHEPPEDGRTPNVVLQETRAVLARIAAGRFQPQLPGDVAHAIVSALVRRMEAFVAERARSIGVLERRVLQGAMRDAQPLLDELFRIRHELYSVRTIAGQSREVYARMLSFARNQLPEETVATQDLVDQFDRLRNVCDAEKELLGEVLDFYQTRIAGELNQFVKRLTALGTMLVTATLIAGIYGMNFAHMPELEWTLGYPLALGMMVVSAGLLGWWFHAKGWL